MIIFETEINKYEHVKYEMKRRVIILSAMIDELERQGKYAFKVIPLGTMKETSVTDNILSYICLKGGRVDYIGYDDSYKETGTDEKNIKSGTSADYVLVIKDKTGMIHKLAFQAKNGKFFEGKGNVYKEIDAQKGGNGPRQIDEYQKFLNNNNKNGQDIIDGYYIFYNGDYKRGSNVSNTKKLNGQSFWILNVDAVRSIMGNKYRKISIDDVVERKDFISFIEFLKGMVR